MSKLTARLRQRARSLKQELTALYYAVRHPGVGVAPKIIATVALGYALCPLDLIPDFIPIIGLLVDLIIVPALIGLAIKLIPKNIMTSCRQKAKEKPLSLRKNWKAAFTFVAVWAVVLTMIVLMLVRALIHKDDCVLLECHMKVFDSGMPEQTYWNSLFDIQAVLSWLNPTHAFPPVAEIGCGYGTFTVPIAKSMGGMVHAFDIDPEMIQKARNNVNSTGLSNVLFYQRDVMEIGTGLPDESMHTVLLFNILHSAENRLLLTESARILQASGSIFILHWRKDVPTPRGPIRESRPDEH